MKCSKARKAQLAVKIFGNDYDVLEKNSGKQVKGILEKLRALAGRIRN